MNLDRKWVAIGATAAVLAAGGAGIAYAVGGGDSEEQVTGPGAERAKGAALDVVGGGTVTEVEYQESGTAGVYEVEVQRDDGSQVEVHIDGSFDSVGTAADDDGSGEEDEASEAGEAGATE